MNHLKLQNFSIFLKKLTLCLPIIATSNIYEKLASYNEKFNNYHGNNLGSKDEIFGNKSETQVLYNNTALGPRNSSKVSKVRYSCPSVMIQVNEKLAFYKAISIIFLLLLFITSHGILLMISQSFYPSLNTDCPLSFISPFIFHFVQNFLLLFSVFFFFFN